MPYLSKSRWKYMQTYSTQELCRFQCHCFIASTTCIVFIPKWYFTARYGKYPVIANCNLMLVSAQIFNYLLRPCKRLFSINYPVFFIQQLTQQFIHRMVFLIKKYPQILQFTKNSKYFGPQSAETVLKRTCPFCFCKNRLLKLKINFYKPF